MLTCVPSEAYKSTPLEITYTFFNQFYNHWHMPKAPSCNELRCFLAGVVGEKRI